MLWWRFSYFFPVEDYFKARKLCDLEANYKPASSQSCFLARRLRRRKGRSVLVLLNICAEHGMEFHIFVATLLTVIRLAIAFCGYHYTKT